MTVGGNNQDTTPLMKQYWDLKSQSTDSLLLFRMGDFYELFGEDAKTASQILEITLTSRDKNKENPLPMAGVPHHSVDGYISKLLKAGKKVAIAEQMGEIKLPNGKTIIERAVVRTLTPAVQFHQDSNDPNYLAILIPTQKQQWILACLDPSTGESRISDPMTETLALSEAFSLPIKHWLRLAHQMPLPLAEALNHKIETLIEDLPKNYCLNEQAHDILKSQFGFTELGSFFKHQEAILALGILVFYTLKSQKQERLAYLQPPLPLRKPGSMILGPQTPDHLDLLPKNDGTPSLFEYLNQTQSACGSRLLKNWITEPLIDLIPIQKRQKALKLLSLNSKLFKPLLTRVYDLERILSRIHTGLANPRDTLALGQTLELHSELIRLLHETVNEDRSQLNTDLHHALDTLTTNKKEYAKLTDYILSRQRDDAPLVSREGGIFKKGFNEDLDRLLELTENGERFLVALEAKEREQTGISSLKVKYNRVFGYYIEITTSHLKNVPPHYQRKQTMVGAERFFTEELKKFEEEILTSQERKRALESKLFLELQEVIRQYTQVIQEFAQILAKIDVYVALSYLVHKNGFVFPEFSESREILIQSGRHPMVDQAQRDSFVPNDLTLDEHKRVMLITGPNMGGKSTVMRQTALIAIMAQMGIPVPASLASLGIVKSLYTRMGAHDAIAKGQSTFMVEMGELAHLLRYADQDSLLILDEIGRGTSTFDGISVAWSTLEWIATKIKARCLFATHYHELTNLEHTLPLIKNAHMAVAQTKPLRFLYQLAPGPTHQSFGIQVAEMAGLPSQVITRAWSVLKELENKPSEQLSLFTGTHTTDLTDESGDSQIEQLELFKNISTLNLNEMTPINALTYLIDLQGKLSKTS